MMKTKALSRRLHSLLTQSSKYYLFFIFDHSLFGQCVVAHLKWHVFPKKIKTQNVSYHVGKTLNLNS